VWLIDSFGCQLNDVVFVDEIIVSVDTQVISLPEGWSNFSTYIAPFYPDIADVVSPLNNVIIIKDSNGMVYWPLYGVNAIGNIQEGEGFQIKMGGTGWTDLNIIGSALIPELTAVLLNQGWSLIGYLRQSPMNIADAFLTVTAPPYSNGELIIIKNYSGHIFWPYFGVNNIGAINPGEGYLIKMSVSSLIYYPPN